MRWVNTGFPLPLGAVNNKRSSLALDNLVNFIIHCIAHPKAATLIGRKNIADRLFSSLQLDSSKARKLLNWVPVISMDQQLKKMN